MIRGLFGGLFSKKAVEQQRIADLLQKVAALSAQVREMAVLRAEAEAAKEHAAAERLHNAAKDQRIAALLLALDRANKRADEAKRIADLNRHGEEKRDLEKFNDAQAARAMSRQTKGHFQAYQNAVRVILDRLDTLGQGNHVTKEDLRKLRELRKDLSDQIQRTI